MIVPVDRLHPGLDEELRATQVEGGRHVSLPGRRAGVDRQTDADRAVVVDDVQIAVDNSGCVLDGVGQAGGVGGGGPAGAEDGGAGCVGWCRRGRRIA